jgi:hypothetical protein
MIANLKNSVCSCGKRAKIFYNGEWFCSLATDFGEFNVLGYCKNNKEEKQ